MYAVVTFNIYAQRNLKKCQKQKLCFFWLCFSIIFDLNLFFVRQQYNTSRPKPFWHMDSCKCFHHFVLSMKGLHNNYKHQGCGWLSYSINYVLGWASRGDLRGRSSENRHVGNMKMFEEKPHQQFSSKTVFFMDVTCEHTEPWRCILQKQILQFFQEKNGFFFGDFLDGPIIQSCTSTTMYKKHSKSFSCAIYRNHNSRLDHL